MARHLGHLYRIIFAPAPPISMPAHDHCGPFRRFYPDPGDRQAGCWLVGEGSGPLPGHDAARTGLHPGVRCRFGQTVPVASTSSGHSALCCRRPARLPEGVSEAFRGTSLGLAGPGWY